jgi:hypothetical protein
MFGGIGLFSCLFMLASKFVPIISVSEMTEEDHKEPILD